MSFLDIFQFLVTNMLNIFFYLWKIEIHSIFKFFFNINYFSYVFLFTFFFFLNCSILRKFKLVFAIWFFVWICVCVCVCLVTKKLSWKLKANKKIKNKIQKPHKFLLWIFLKPVKYFHYCDWVIVKQFISNINIFGELDDDNKCTEVGT